MTSNRIAASAAVSAANASASSPRAKKGRLPTFAEMRAFAERKERAVEKTARTTAARRRARKSTGACEAGRGSQPTSTSASRSAHAAEGTDERAPAEALPEEEWRRGDVWLTVHIAARRLGISRRRVYTLIYEGRIRAINFGQRLWRINERELDGYMARCRRRCLEDLGLDLGVGSGRADLPPRSGAST